MKKDRKFKEGAQASLRRDEESWLVTIVKLGEAVQVEEETVWTYTVKYENGDTEKGVKETELTHRVKP